MSRLRRHRRAPLLGALLALLPFQSRAQSSAPVAAASDSSRRPSLFTRADPWIIGGFIAGAAAISPFDRQIANEMREPSAQNNHTESNAAKAFNFLGSPGTLIAGVALYGVGRVGHFERVADLGLHSTEALAASAGVTYIIKGLAGRERPSHAGVNDPDDFHFGGGFSSSRASFPSGHATAAFSMATSVTLETHRWWPHSTWYIAPIMYGGATLVGVARLYTNAHWASDVILGAGIGTFTALKVDRFNHLTNRDNRVNRWLLTAVPSVSPSLDGRGATIGWTFAAPR